MQSAFSVRIYKATLGHKNCGISYKLRFCTLADRVIQLLLRKN
jgi:hypothetical protein